MRLLNLFHLCIIFSNGAFSAKVRTKTPPMGWNSYNHYGCNPNETIIKTNAKGLVDQGLLELGYDQITVDCGWATSYRDSQNRLVWDPQKFPSGGPTLGSYVHGLNLKFGLYSGAGVKQCGSETIKASLGYETVDAAAFAEWGGDSLKYDNCWPDDKDTFLVLANLQSPMVQYNYPENDPSTRFRTMSDALEKVSRSIVYQVCQWGVGENLGTWARQISNSWRISNDIENKWKSIWRIANQVVPFYKHTGVGMYADMDMLMVGNSGLNIEEEKTHFGLWAINKSPLVIGCSLVPGATRKESITILKNKEVIAINQDSLGKQAQLVLRYTEEEYDIWAGELSSGRKVVAVVNWSNATKNIPFEPIPVGVSSASGVRDVYAATDLGSLAAPTTYNIPGHGIKLLVLSGISAAPAPKELFYYKATTASLTGGAQLVSCGTDCAPVNSKIGNINTSARASFSNVDAGGSGKKLVSVDFINYEVALGSAWADGTNTREMLISVNSGAAKRFSFPISGGNWFETGRLNIVLDGFVAGAKNTITFTGGKGSTWAPDLVGFAILG
ncbi:carbohydrate-binding module family 35 protein [Zopfia rhizophila CBS 207.26]|uniref:Alpha-galactosidase n=1 Tax=Zopfia rhizophila CBS 207.26 TaxID=1314779 RepID=A0A6A6DZ95_9PEZI|nr:carbohydrate-binding module family 35 protein [Zopfia rhizophila CBS 207.26]